MKAWQKTTRTKLIVATTAFIVLFCNATFFANVTDVYPLKTSNVIFLISLVFVLAASVFILLSTVCFRYTIKPILVFILLASSIASYFMSVYGVIIDEDMIRSIALTDVGETRDLFNLRLIATFIFLGIIPSILICKVTFEDTPFKTESLSKIKVGSLGLLLSGIMIFASSGFFYSFIREHKLLRYYINPAGWLYAGFSYIKGAELPSDAAVKPLGEHAKIPATDLDRELIIMVVGETARADRFSLNGYTRKTNPLLEKENVISFTNFESCGTSTAISLPCMFSVFGREQFTHSKGESVENALDVLVHAGVHVLWRDNNSDSKGVAVRVEFEDFKTNKNNRICDSECRDEGMLAGLEDYIDRYDTGDIFIVLHSMGNHGPAYYKRYPKTFEKFRPTCNSNQLESCSRDEIGNAYDNAILYTDFFLAKVINFLKSYSRKFETAMIYVSDHGESLGEGGLYLHGMPYFLAPENQTHVAAVMWFGNSFKLDRHALKEKAEAHYSHDNVFHTLLGLMEVQDPIYDREQDIVRSIL